MAERFSLIKGDDLQLLLSRYSDLEFLDDISKFKCIKCHKLAIDHHFTNCGHIICSNCKELFENEGMKCPQCHLPIKSIDNQQVDVLMKITALKSKCPNAKYGCSFSTNLSQIPGHVRDCKFSKQAALPVLSKESKTIHGLYDKIEEHNKQFGNIETEMGKLKDYNVTLEKYKETLEKYNETLKMELKGLRSDLNIETRLQKDNFEELKKGLQFAEDNLKKEIETKLQEMMNDLEMKLNIKITETEKRFETAVDKLNQRIDEHVFKEVDEKFISLKAERKEKRIKDWLNEKSNVNQLLDGLLFGSSKEQSYFESLCYKWTISNIRPLEEKKDFEIFSDIFPIYGYALKAQLSLTYNSSVAMYLEICFKDDEKENQTVDLKCLPTVTYILKNSNKKEVKRIIRCSSCLFNTTIKYNEFCHGKYIENISELMSSTDESVDVLVLVEPLSFINKMPIGGTITDTVDHYEKKLQMEKNRSFYGYRSPPFLTHAGGYRVRIRMFLNGNVHNDKRGLLAVETFLSGEFDSQLEKRFRHETIITLIHPNDATKNITVKKHFMTTDSCTIAIASEDEISSGGFVVNDSLKYEVTIEPTPVETAGK